jgi:hypothetical protein
MIKNKFLMAKMAVALFTGFLIFYVILTTHSEQRITPKDNQKGGIFTTQQLIDTKTPISRIHLTTVNAKIEVTWTDEESLKLIVEGTRLPYNFNFEQKGNSLNFSPKKSRNTFNFENRIFENRKSDSSKDVVKVFIPKSWPIRQLELRSVNGPIHLLANTQPIHNLKIETVNGPLNFDNVVFTVATIDSVNSRMNLHLNRDLAKSISIESSSVNGSLSINNQTLMGRGIQKQNFLMNNER